MSSRVNQGDLTLTENSPRSCEASDFDYSLARAGGNGLVSVLGDMYVRHRRRVYSLCLRMTGDAAEAEDLTQDVFIQLLRKVGSFRGESQFTTWLYRLTVNQVLMHFRRTIHRNDQAYSEREISCPQFSRNSTVMDRIVLESALSKLPPGCRTVFVMFDVEGYNHGEIARMCGCSVGNSKSQLHKARKRLRRLLRTTHAVSRTVSTTAR